MRRWLVVDGTEISDYQQVQYILQPASLRNTSILPSLDRDPLAAVRSRNGMRSPHPNCQRQDSRGDCRRLVRRVSGRADAADKDQPRVALPTSCSYIRFGVASVRISYCFRHAMREGNPRSLQPTGLRSTPLSISSASRHAPEQTFKTRRPWQNTFPGDLRLTSEH